MAFQPKTEPGSSPRSISTTNKKNYNEMNISELVSVLRVAYQMKDFDEVEEELVNREAKLRAEIGPLREKIEVERLKSIEAEERLKIREEQCKRGKRAQENYEQLLKEVKTGGLVEKTTVEELREKNVALEREVCELKEFKKRMLDDGKSVAELRVKIRVLEEEKVGDKSALDALNMKNTELEEAVKKNLTVIEELRTENGKLTDEKHKLNTLVESLERRYSELRVSDVELEENIMLLMSEDASDCGNTEEELPPGVSYAVIDEKDVGDHELENDTGEPVTFQTNEDTYYSVDTSTAQSLKKGNKDDAVGALGVKLKLEKEFIDLGDDDSRCTSQGLHGEKAISQIIAENEHLQSVEMIKRKRVFDIQASTSTSTSSAVKRRKASTCHLPSNMSLLRLQDKHVTKALWEGNGRLLRPRRHKIWAAKNLHLLDVRVKNAINVAGFGPLLDMGNVDVNHHLITALVERWRTETHTFHFSIGEVTVTLEDVAVQLGLPIDGESVTGVTSGNLIALCEPLLGSLPPEGVAKGNSIKLSWLNNAFQQLPHDADNIVVQQHARAHIMTIIGSLLMPDTSGSRVHLMYLLLLQDLSSVQKYSWGSAVLACLYRALDHGVDVNQDNIGGCMLLLQSWAWDRITCICPTMDDLTADEVARGYGFPLARRWSRPGQRSNLITYMLLSLRQTFDQLKPKEFLWTPYARSPLKELIIGNVSPVSRAIVPMICFATVEPHPADRVMRQFGLRQIIPKDPINLDKLHKEDMRGRANRHWPQDHKTWIVMWNDRHNRLIEGVSFHRNGHLRKNTPYMQWYFQRTIRYISSLEDQETNDEYDVQEEQLQPLGQDIG